MCDYNPWGTVTGRLATNPNSFPHPDHEQRVSSVCQAHQRLAPRAGLQCRRTSHTLLALSGEAQPQNDIHDWNVKNIFNGTLTREEAKVKTFAWLYSSKENKDLERLYNKDFVRNKYWDGFKIKTDYGRIIENVDEHHAVSDTRARIAY